MKKIARAGIGLDTTTTRYEESLRTDSMSLGTYTVAAGAADAQQPHSEDEVYVITAGRGQLWTPTSVEEVGPGDVLYVPAREPHRFQAVTADLTALVVFAPAETRPSDE